MRRFIFALFMTMLWCVCPVLAQDYTKIAMLGSPTASEMQAASSVDDDERAAYQWFTSKGGTYICAADVANGKSLNSYKAVWIVLDREIGEASAEAFANRLRNANDPLFNSVVVNALANYYKGGGNLFLTNHAGILLKETGRYPHYPYSLGSFNSASAVGNGDTWYARVSYHRDGAAKDLSSDPLYTGISIESFDGFKRFAYTNANPKEDHNCFFNLDLPSGNYNDNVGKWNDVRSQYGAEMLAVWPHINDYCSAAIVRWLPFDDYHGKAISVGFGGWEYSAIAAGNAIEKFTINALQELVSDIVYQPVQPEAPEEGIVLAHYDMDKVDGKVAETVSGNTYDVRGSFSESIPGAVGNALRTDAFSTYVEGAALPSNIGKKMTIDLWCAAETYPMGSMDTDAEGWGTIAGNGSISFNLSSRGRLQFTCNLGSVTTAENYFPKYQWNHFVAAVDGEAGTITLYNNGVQVAQKTGCNGSVKAGSGTMLIGKSKNSIVQFSGCLDAFNGLIDDITVYTGTGMVSALNAQQPEHEADVFVDPSVRFAGNVLRPQFHAGASANWGNETHGLLYYGGKYHAFYQKNANGQYLSHMHWGHLTSDNLLTWREEQTAVAPSMNIDWKGCWSGCIYQNNGFNNGKPTIFYTGVDSSRPHIIQANPNDDNLIGWTKQTGIFNGSDDAMAADYRDCFVFENGGKYYMMIGTNKDGRGAASLHVYENGTWTKSEGDYVFAPSEATSSIGTFWEMPVLTKMGDKWLFCVSTIGAADVRALYWIGTLQGSGKNLKFVPDNNQTARTVEFEGFAKAGFGLLSPSVMQKDGKTVIIGIVPDKLNDVQNTENGWSHTYSLPREWDIQNGELVQKPYSGVETLRGKALNANNISGRMLELDGTFRGNDDFGYTILGGSTTIKVSGNTLTVTSNNQKYNAYAEKAWSHTFATRPSRLHVFVDHSVVDIFVDDKYATSTRVYPNESAGDAATVFGTTQSFSAYALNTEDVPAAPSMVTIYNGNSEQIYTDDLSKVDLADNALVFAGEETDVKNCVINGHAASIVLTDVKPFYSPLNIVADNLTYTHVFKNDKWQMLYVPFSIDYSEWEDKAEIAEVIAVHSYDDGARVTIEFARLKEGLATRPNTPYMICSKDGKDVEFSLSGKTLTATPETGGSVWCASTKQKFTLTGVYQQTNIQGNYIIKDGSFVKYTGNAILPPFRFYMTIEDVDNGYGTTVRPAAKAPQIIQISVDGEDVTGIEDIRKDEKQEKDVFYDLSGRRIVSPTRGIYIKNNVKVLIK